MKKIVNSVHLEGYLYGHTLEKRTAGENAKNPGAEFIRGNLDILTDGELNVVPVSFSYVPPKFKSGAANATYTTLLNIIENGDGKTYLDCGTEAMKIKVDSALGVNDFYNNDEELVTYQMTDGGFVHAVPTFSDDRNSFNVDVLLTGAVFKEADEERGTEDHLVLSGATFNFAKRLLPVSFVVKDSGGMKYFESMDISSKNPVFIKLWGEIVSSTIETQHVEESAFGEPAVKTTVRRLREWVVVGAAKEPYDFGDEAVLTEKEVQAAVADRETYLAGVKKNHDEYVASKASGSGGTKTPSDSGFSF